MATVTTKRPIDVKYLINSAIGIILMFGFGLIPAPAPVTPVGMQVAGVFLGVIYLWTTVEIFWPSILSLAALAATDYATMAAVAASSFGNSSTFLCLFAIAIVGVAELHNVSDYILSAILKIKMINGHPWCFTMVMFFSAFLVSILVNFFVGLFLLWGLFYKLCAQVGYKKGDKYPSMLIFGILVSGALGANVLPYRGMALVLTSTLRSMDASASLMYLPFFLSSVLASVLTILGYVAFMKFICRCDISPLKGINVSSLDTQILPPMSRLQKFLLGYLFLMAFLLFAPAYLPTSWPLVSTLNKLGPLGILCILFAVLCMIRVDGKSIVDFKELAHKKIMWDIIFLIAAVFAISGALTADATGIKALILGLLNPIFAGQSPYVFVILLCLAAVILTNITSNAVVAILLLTISVIFSTQFAIQLDGIVVLLVFCTNLAFLLPASSFYAAMLYANEWLRPKDIQKSAAFIMIWGFIISIFVIYPLYTFLA